MTALAPDLLAFIRSAVCSMFGVETLLLMRSRAQAAWTARELAAELRAHPKIIERTLSRFETAGLVARSGLGYVWRPALPALASLCDRLAAAYARRPAEVKAAVGLSDNDLRGFSDAFRLR